MYTVPSDEDDDSLDSGSSTAYWSAPPSADISRRRDRSSPKLPTDGTAPSSPPAGTSGPGDRSSSNAPPGRTTPSTPPSTSPVRSSTPKQKDEVSPEVHALGLNPYPRMRQRRVMPELNDKETPTYDEYMPWMGNNLLLHFITPAQLMHLGCINVNATAGLVSPMFSVNKNDAALASKDRNRSSTFGDNTGIHPVFGRRNWRETSDFEYECLKPSLRLATKLLEMEVAVDLWTALAKPWIRSPGTPLAESKGGYYRYFTGQSTAEEREATVAETRLLDGHVIFEWADLDDACAQTSQAEAEGLRKTGHS